MNLLESLNWRYATKRFDADRKVSDADLRTIKKATNLAATSFGLQPYRVFVVSDDETKERLKMASYNQSQLTEASHVFVFCHKLETPPAYVDKFMARTAEVRGMNPEDLEGYGDYIKGSLAGKSPEDIIDWNRRQAYIALGHLLVACATLKVDACPMEGFDPNVYDEILGLQEKGLGAAVVATVGYRSEEDKTQSKEKVRFPLEEMFLELE